MTDKTCKKPNKTNAFRRVKLRHIGQLDGRTAAVRAAMRMRAELVRACGGEDRVSPQKSLLIDTITRTSLMLSDVDAFLLERGVIDRRRRAAVPAVAMRETMQSNLLRALTALGLEAVEPSIAQIMADFAARKPAAATDDASLPELPADVEDAPESSADANATQETDS